MEFDLDTEEKPAPAAPAKDEMVTIPKAEWESTRRESQERDEAAKYWAGVARSGGGRPPQEQVEEPADDLDANEFLDENAADGLEGDTPDKLVDDFAAKGVSALKARGFITAADAQKLAVEVAAKVTRELIGRERQKITSDTRIMSEFPELKDQSSELFKATARIYQAAVAMDPNAKRTPAALFLAAQAAKAGLKPAQPRRDGDDEYQPEGESERRRRAASQDGRPRGRGPVDEHDDMLGDEARSVIKAFGISEDEFKASQKAMGGGRRR